MRCAHTACNKTYTLLILSLIPIGTVLVLWADCCGLLLSVHCPCPYSGSQERLTESEKLNRNRLEHQQNLIIKVRPWEGRAVR